MHGQADAVRELLRYVPSHLKSEEAGSQSTHAILKDLTQESALTALHLASLSGSEDAVRALLNSASTNVEATSSPSGRAALHYACHGGHIGVSGLLLSRSTALLQVFSR